MIKKIDNHYIIQMKNIRKEFGAILANDNINLNIRKGEIHAIIGENGAGKSTLMSILFGHYQPTSGQILIKGQKVSFSSPEDASKHGLGMVHQHFKLIDTFSVLENIVLGEEPVKNKYFVNLKNARLKLNIVSKKYKLNINPDLLIKNASVGEQQRTEILKILYKNSEILIFDEPTAVLTPIEIKGFLNTLKEFKKMGKTIIIITHKLKEVKEVADSATIIRKGKNAGYIKVSEVSETKIAEIMVGRKLEILKNNVEYEGKKKVLLELEKINVPHREKKNILGLKDFSLKLFKGEILAIAGVEGSGQMELSHAISGLTKIKSGVIKMGDKFIKNKSIKYRNENGLSFIPEDRLKYAVFSNLNINDNSVIKLYNKKPFSKMGFIKGREIQRFSSEIISSYDVRGANSGSSILSDVSGGNQQKMVVGRELLYEHDILLISQPTRGMDIGAIEFIHKEILEEKKKGKAILLISYELSEVMNLADKILVLNDGNKVGLIKNNGISSEEIGLMMAGITDGIKGLINE